jgi:hypothetical protein
LPFDDYTARIFFITEPVEAIQALTAKNSSTSYLTNNGPSNYWNDDYRAKSVDYDYIDEPIGESLSPTGTPKKDWLSETIKHCPKIPIIFNELFKTRRQACKAFYSLLLCINSQIVRVEQQIPFGLISIIPK